MKAKFSVYVLIACMVGATQERHHLGKTLSLHDRRPISTILSTNDSLKDIALHDELKYNATLSKCKCKASEAWYNTKCVATQTKVAVHDPQNGQTTVVDTGQFQEVRVDQPQCPEGHVLATLDSLRDSENQFSLLPSGHLYWQQRQFQLYCIEHWVDDDGKLIGWFAEVCLWPPSVPRCCPQGQALSTDLSCSSRASQELAPPVMVDGVEVRWSAEAPGQVEAVNCLPHQEILTKNLTYRETFLNYSPDRVSLVWSPTPFQRKEQAQDFCVGVQEGREGYTVHVCFEDEVAAHKRQCDKCTCVRKCCSESQILIGSDCITTEYDADLWKLSFSDEENLSSSTSFPHNITLITGFPLCQHYFMLEPHLMQEDEFILLNDGFLYLNAFKERYPASRYCIENVRDREGVINEQALVCFADAEPKAVCDVTKKYVYPVLLLISCVFLAVTLGTYAGVPDLRGSLHGRCLISLVSTLLVAYSSLAIASLAAGKIQPPFCRIIASVMHLAFLASFFWLNTTCFNIWSTLREMRTVSGSRAWARRRFLLYSLYSWGCPLVVIIVAIIVEELPDTYTVIRPDFGTDFCWFTNKRSVWVYFYGYVLVLVVANIVLFGLMVYFLCCSQNPPPPDRRWSHIRERMLVSVKLFLVMGVTWLAEVISWQESTCQAWIATDVINALQGLSIFLVFVCKRATLRQVRDRWAGCCRGKEPQSAVASGTTFTSFKQTDSRHSRSSFYVESLNLRRTSVASSGPDQSQKRDATALGTEHQPEPLSASGGREERGERPPDEETTPLKLAEAGDGKTKTLPASETSLLT